MNVNSFIYLRELDFELTLVQCELAQHWMKLLLTNLISTEALKQSTFHLSSSACHHCYHGAAHTHRTERTMFVENSAVFFFHVVIV